MIVLKYELTIGLNHLNLPTGAKVLTVHEQNNKIQMWVSAKYIEPSSISRDFYVALTGYHFEFDSEVAYCGSVFIGDASYVLHVFEIL